MEGANVGFLAGTPAGFDTEGNPTKLVALDFDCRDPDDLALLLASAPASPAEKRGHVGLTRLFRAPRDLTSRAYDGPSGRLIDLLCDGRFCVIPPSRHPATGRPYEWTRGPVPVSELPILTSADIEKLEEALALVGWEREAETARPTPGPRIERVRGDYADDFAEANGEALARLDEWFALLNLPGTRRAGPGVFRAIPVWRPSGSGRPTEIRKPNLSASSGLGAVPAGIRDFGASGADASLTAIDLVQRALGLSAVEAMTWLRETLGLDDDNGVVIDLGRQAKSETAPAPVGAGTEAAQVVPGEAGATVAEPNIGATHGAADEVETELPAHLCEVPGLVGDVARWITATARKPQPAHALAMSIVLIGTLAGRKYCGPTQSGTHLFILATGPTGSGKNAPKKAAAQLLAAAGFERVIGPSSFSSATALIEHVADCPASLCVMDEFAMLIGKINSKNGSSHEKQISGEMRQFWTLSFEEYKPPKWASGRTRIQLPPIISPALSIIGITTADELYTVLQGADVLSGFLNRFTLVPTLSNPIDVEPTADVFNPPDELVKGLQAIADVGGPLAQATMHGFRPEKPLVQVPWDGGAEGLAYRTFRALIATVAEMTEHEALTQRTAEMAVRLATIRAIGIAGPHARVTVDDMQWGADFALWSTRRLIADVNAHMVESEHQARAKFVIRLLKDAGGYLSRTDLCRKVNHRFDARTLDSVIDGLLQAAQIRLKELEPGKTGRKPAGYFLLSGA
jgi:hypothetical protein